MKVNIIDNKHITFFNLTIGTVFINEISEELCVKSDLSHETLNTIRLVEDDESSVKMHTDGNCGVIIPERIDVVL